MQTEAPNLEALIQQLKLGNPEALEFFYTFSQQPESLGSYFQSLQTTQDTYVRRFVLTQIRSFLKNKTELIPQDFLPALFMQLSSMIPQETDISSRDDMCELLSFIPNCEQQLFEYSCKLVQSQQPPLICASFVIVSNSFLHFGDEQENVVAVFAPVAIQLLLNPDPQYQSYAFSLLFTFLSHDLDFESLQNSTEFEHAISAQISRINPGLTKKEFQNIFTLIDLVITKAFPFFLQYIPTFTEFFTGFLINQEYPLEVRMHASVTMTSLFSIASEYIQQLVPQLLSNYIQLAIEISTADPDSENYTILAEPIKSMEGVEELFDFFMASIEQLLTTGNIMAFRIAYDIMSSIYVLSYEKANDNLGKMVQICIDGLANSGTATAEGFVVNNPYIPEAVSQVVTNFYEFVEDDLEEYNQPLIEALFNFISIPKCCFAIANILSHSESAQENVERIQQLIRMIRTVLSQPQWAIEDVELLVELLETFLESLNSINESLFEELKDIILQFIGSTTAFKLLAFRLFSALIPICPQSTSQLIDSFIKAGFEIIDQYDSEVNSSVLFFFDIVVQNQAQFIIPYIPQVIEFVINIFKLDKNLVIDTKMKQLAEQGEEEDDEETKDNLYAYQNTAFSEMIQRSLQILLNICLLNPAECSNFFESIYQNLCILMNNNDEQIARTAVKSFEQLAGAYIMVNADTGPILDALLHQMEAPDMHSLEYLATIWSAIATVMGIVGRDLIFPKAGDIFLALSKVFIDKDSNNKFNDAGNKFEISSKFRAPVFQVLDTFVDELQADFHQFAEPIVQNLLVITTKTSTHTHVFCSRSLAHIAATFPANDENGNKLLTSAYQTAMNSIQSAKYKEKTIGLSTLAFIVNHRPDLSAANRNDLVQYCVSVIEKVEAGSQEEPMPFVNECVSLYFTLILQYQMVGTNDELVNPLIISHAADICEVEFDDPILISYSRFAHYIVSIDSNSFFKMFISLVITALCSSRLVLRQIPHETLAFCAEMVSSLPENETLSLLQFNMTKLNSLKNIVAQIKG